MDDRRRSFAVVVLALALLALPAMAHALEEPTFVLKGGVSLSRLYSGSDTFDPHWKTGSSIGASANFRISSLMAFQPEIFYVMKGFAYGKGLVFDDAGNVLGANERFLSVDYLEVPVLLRFDLAPERLIMPHVLIGPAFSVKQRERYEVRGTGATSYETDNLKKFDTGIVLGAGIEFGQGLNGWMIEGRFTHGLSPIEYGSVKDRNVNVQILTGWMYRP